MYLCRVICLFSLLTTALGCAGSVIVTRMKPAEVDLPGIDALAVDPKSGHEDGMLTGVIEQRIFESDRYESLDRETLALLQAEMRINQDPNSDQSIALGEFRAAPAIVSADSKRVDYDESYEREARECSKTVEKNGERVSVKYPCTQHTRRGKVSYDARIKVVEVSTGRTLASRTFAEVKEDRTQAVDDAAPPIDSDRLIAECRDEVADAFMRMIAPYPVQEKVFLVQDSDLPSIATGNTFLKAGSYAAAREQYIKAVTDADSRSELSDTSRAKAHYALGLCLALEGRHDEGLSEISRALDLAPNKKWIEMSSRVQIFKAEAERVRQQQEQAVKAPDSISRR